MFQDVPESSKTFWNMLECSRTFLNHLEMTRAQVWEIHAFKHKGCWQPSTIGKNSKDKNEELSVLVDDKLAEINDSIVTLMGCVDEMEKRIEELEFEGDFEELRGEMQAAVNSMAANVTKDVQALRASQDACKGELEFYKVEGQKLTGHELRPWRLNSKCAWPQ